MGGRARAPSPPSPPGAPLFQDAERRALRARARRRPARGNPETVQHKGGLRRWLAGLSSSADARQALATTLGSGQRPPRVARRRRRRAARFQRSFQACRASGASSGRDPAPPLDALLQRQRRRRAGSASSSSCGAVHGPPGFPRGSRTAARAAPAPGGTARPPPGDADRGPTKRRRPSDPSTTASVRGPRHTPCFFCSGPRGVGGRFAPSCPAMPQGRSRTGGVGPRETGGSGGKRGRRRLRALAAMSGARARARAAFFPFSSAPHEFVC